MLLNMVCTSMISSIGSQKIACDDILFWAHLSEKHVLDLNQI